MVPLSPKRKGSASHRVATKAVFSTPWFTLVEKKYARFPDPHYSLRTKDYVSVIALTPKKEWILVRQFRPAVDRFTWEWPGGHVEPGETPRQAAIKELREETGYEAEHMVLLGELTSDSGRLGNTLWCFFAENVRPVKRSAGQAEKGIDVIVFRGSVRRLMRKRIFRCAFNVASLALAASKERLSF
jgi:ADP-ribose pyrophosphatase